MNTGLVDIRGKEYKTVALRIDEFRQKWPDYTVETEIIEATDKIVVMKAIIKDTSGRVISTGHAEENRGSSSINKTSAMENCETSAVGRALAFFGLAGSEIASADEVAAAINGKPIDRTDLSDDIAALETAQTWEELQSAWKGCFLRNKGNTSAIDKLTVIKDACKEALS